MRALAAALAGALLLAGACRSGGGVHLDQRGLCETEWDSGGKDFAQGETREQFVADCIHDLNEGRGNLP